MGLSEILRGSGSLIIDGGDDAGVSSVCADPLNLRRVVAVSGVWEPS